MWQIIPLKSNDYLYVLSYILTVEAPGPLNFSFLDINVEVGWRIFIVIKYILGLIHKWPQISMRHLDINVEVGWRIFIVIKYILGLIHKWPQISMRHLDINVEVGWRIFIVIKYILELIHKWPQICLRQYLVNINQNHFLVISLVGHCTAITNCCMFMWEYFFRFHAVIREPVLDVLMF